MPTGGSCRRSMKSDRAVFASAWMRNERQDEELAGGSFAVRDGRAFKRDRAFVTGPLSSIIRSDTASPWPWKPVAGR